ncbi:MAG: hypothetical protein EXS31_04060 [Pedosphaera sp.]|nr:hypothetical protein [Pedosphaera sp.]
MNTLRILGMNILLSVLPHQKKIMNTLRILNGILFCVCLLFICNGVGVDEKTAMHQIYSAIYIVGGVLGLLLSLVAGVGLEACASMVEGLKTLDARAVSIDGNTARIPPRSRIPPRGAQPQE